MFVCECGSNIKDRVDVPRVIREVSRMPDVVVAEPYRLLCSPDGRSFLEDRARKEGLTHVVVAACSPREHQQTFMTVCEAAGVNPYLLQLVNIREQCAWVTEDPAQATEKAIRMIKGAIGRVRYQSPLSRRVVTIDPDVLVVGGGPAGIEAALALAGTGRKVHLVEKEAVLGGMLLSLQLLGPGLSDPLPVLQDKIARLTRHPQVEVLTGHQVVRVLGFLGNFEVTVRSLEPPSAERHMDVGSIILATGAQLSEPRHLPSYGDGMDDVLTAQELEEMNRAGTIHRKDGSAPRSVAIVHCVGREAKGYCSAICCTYGLKLSAYIRRKLPNANVCHLYQDLCVPGKDHQAFCEDVVRSGVSLLRATEVRVSKGAQGPEVQFLQEDGSPNRLAVDMVVLLPAVEPRAGTKETAEMLGIGLDRYGFFARKNEKLDPVVSDREGILVVGAAQGPCDHSGSLVQAEASAGWILASLVPGRQMEIEAKTCHIQEALCQGCRTCVQVCPFGAIDFDERRRVAKVNEAICRGCGNCAAACPSGAAVVKHFTYDQIYQEIAEAVK